MLKKIINTTIGKIALGFTLINMILGVYDIIKVSDYISTGLIVGACIALLIIIGLLLLCATKHKKTSIIFNLFLSIVLIIGLVTLNRTSQFTNAITNTTEYEYVDIVVLKDSPLTIDSDLKDKVMGAYLDDELGLKRAREILLENNKEQVKERLFDKVKDAYEALKSGKIDMLVLTNEMIGYLEDEVNYKEETKTLFSKQYVINSDYVTKDVDVLSEPFTLYLCGTDASGSKSINDASRADSNMLLTVNPNTKKISLQIIPRDLYSYVEHKNGRTKLSWTGRYGGITTSMKSLEHELGININYYAKINWQGLKDLVDALGGIDVYSHFAYELNGFHYKKGMNHINGSQALLMCMERKSLPNNERSRGLQQMEVLKGIINKIIQEPSFDKLMALLNTIEKNFITNYPEEKLIDAFNLMLSMRAQLGDIDSYTMQGDYFFKYDDFNTSFNAEYFGPTDEEIAKVRDRINNIILGR